MDNSLRIFPKTIFTCPATNTDLLTFQFTFYHIYGCNSSRKYLALFGDPGVQFYLTLKITALNPKEPIFNLLVQLDQLGHLSIDKRKSILKTLI